MILSYNFIIRCSTIENIRLSVFQVCKPFQPRQAWHEEVLAAAMHVEDFDVLSSLINSCCGNSIVAIVLALMNRKITSRATLSSVFGQRVSVVWWSIRRASSYLTCHRTSAELSLVGARLQFLRELGLHQREIHRIRQPTNEPKNIKGAATVSAGSLGPGGIY